MMPFAFMRMIASGSSPGDRFECQQNTKPLSTGAEPRTVEAHAMQLQLLELREDFHIRCNRPAQRVAAKRELFEIHEGREQLKRFGKRWSCATQHILSRKD